MTTLVGTVSGSPGDVISEDANFDSNGFVSISVEPNEALMGFDLKFDVSLRKQLTGENYLEIDNKSVTSYGDDFSSSSGDISIDNNTISNNTLQLVIQYLYNRRKTPKSYDLTISLNDEVVAEHNFENDPVTRIGLQNSWLIPLNIELSSRGQFLLTATVDVDMVAAIVNYS